MNARLPDVIVTPLPRTSTLGSTDVRTIATGLGWLDLYLEKTGAKERTDLTYAWKPRLGIETEALHAWWHGHSEGVEVVDTYGDDRLTRASLPPHHTTSCDRIVVLPEGQRHVLELKHTNERNNLRDAATYYMGQLQWQMHVLNQTHMRFSIIRGNNEPEWGYVERDDKFIDQLITMVDAFWWHVQNGEPPEADPLPAKEQAAALKKAAAAVALNGFKPYDMTDSNAWAVAAGDYLATKVAADRHKAANETVRALIPADAETASGHGLSFKRDARGAYRVTIDDEQLAYWTRRFDAMRERVDG